MKTYSCKCGYPGYNQTIHYATGQLPLKNMYSVLCLITGGIFLLCNLVIMTITIEKMQSVLCLVTGGIFLLLLCVYIASPANLLIVLAILTTKVTLYQIPCEPCVHHVYATCPVFFLC